MTEKKTTHQWERQFWHEVHAQHEQGGGEVLVIDEANSSISEMYAMMLAKGLVGVGVAHAAGRVRMDEAHAIAGMMNAQKNPLYTEIGERQERLKAFNKQMEEMRMAELAKLNNAIDEAYTKAQIQSEEVN